jgi:DNA-binding LacI/PurR family transcriptional regulator
MPRPTLESVAREADVSRQTVSNVLNAPHLVAPETRERVRATITRLGYRPHQAARTLRTRRSRLVGVRIQPPQDDVIHVLLDRFLHRVTAQAQQSGYRVLLFSATGDEDETSQYEQLLEDHDVDAFILTGTHVGDRRTVWLAERRVPFVTFGRPWDDLPAGHGWVDVDGAAGTREATRHLLALGHRRIAFLGWTHDNGAGDDRRAGWREAADEAGILRDGFDLKIPDGIEAARSAAATLLDLAAPPTALVCASDSLAMGALAEVTGRGLRPGSDIAVFGFDNTPTAAVVGLSSVAQPLDEVATECLRMVHAVLDARAEQDVRDARSAPSGLDAAPAPPAPAPPAPVLLAPRLVLRPSTGPTPTDPTPPPTKE